MSGYRFLDGRQVLRAEDDLRCCGVLFEVAHPFGARDRDDVGPLGQDPRQRQLPRRASLGSGEVDKRLDECEIGLAGLPMNRG